MSKLPSSKMAFPTVVGFPGRASIHHGGMTLRDYFAAHAVRAKWGNGEAMTPEEAAKALLVEAIRAGSAAHTPPSKGE